MSDYVAPVKDMSFVLKDVIGIERIGKLPGCEEVTADLVDAIFDEAGKFSASVLAPLNRSGDEEGAKWNNGVVTTPVGFKEAYRKYAERFSLWSHRFIKYDEVLVGTPDYFIAKRSDLGKTVLGKPLLLMVEAKKNNFDKG